MRLTAAVALLALCCACGESGEPVARSTRTTPPTDSRTTPASGSAPVRDERGRGLVQLSPADNGHVVLVDLGQRLQITLPGHFVPPYLVGRAGPTGQDRVLYVQHATGAPDAPTYARLLAGNPGNAVVRSHDVACGRSCPAAQTYQVRVYVNTTPSP